MYRIPTMALLLYLIFTSVFASGEKRIFVDSYTYVLTENDTKNDARRYCFLKAKNKVTDKVKDYLKDTPRNLLNYTVYEEDIDMLTEALLNVSTKEEKWTFSENKLSVSISAMTDINVEYLMQRILTIKSDDELLKKMIAEQNDLKEKEKEYAAIQEKLSKADTEAAIPLRKTRQALSTQMDKLEEIKYLVVEKTKTAAEKIQPGMTIDEVVNIAGQPRSTATCERPDYLNYGNIWISISNGVVTGKIPVEEWTGPCLQKEGLDEANFVSNTKADNKEKEPGENDKYLIILKNGQEIPTPNYYTIEDVIYYKRFGGIIGVEESKIAEITELRK